MKLYVLFSVLVLGVLGYIIVEIKHTRKERRLKEIESRPKSAQPPEEEPETPETDDEKDDLEEDIVVTHL